MRRHTAFALLFVEVSIPSDPVLPLAPHKKGCTLGG